MMLGMLCIAISDLGTGFANSLPSLVLARLGLGLGRAFSEAGERGMLADLANKVPDWRGRGLALQQACIAVGIACGASGGGFLVEKEGVRSGFFCVSIAAGLCLALYSLIPETMINEIGATNNVEKDADEENDGAGWVRLLQTSSTWRSLAMCQCGASFGYACKITTVPLLAANYLPGGVVGAGLLLSSAGLVGLLGATLGGFVTDQFGSRFAASSAGLVSGLSFALIPFGLSLNQSSDLVLPDIIQYAIAQFGGLGPASFVLLVLLWSVGASAQGPALVALAQQEAPAGQEATASGLPRAFGDGAYIVAPLVLGFVSDAVGDSMKGAACSVAGVAICIGSVAILLVPSETVTLQCGTKKDC